MFLFLKTGQLTEFSEFVTRLDYQHGFDFWKNFFLNIKVVLGNMVEVSRFCELSVFGNI